MKKVKYINIEGSAPAPTLNAPVKALTDDGLYFVKFYDSFIYGNPSERYKELINEFICFELAKILELPIPDGAIVEVPDGVEVSYLKGTEKIVVKPSLSFGSKNIEGIVTAFSGPEDILKCSNKQDLLPIMVFDAWIHNKDRDENFSNTLFEKVSFQMFIIDHGNVFGSGNLWNFGCLPNDQQGKIMVDIFANDGLYNSILESVDLHQDIESTKDRFSKLSYDVIKEIIFSVPKEWYLSENDAIALLDYLTARLQHIDDYIDLIFKRGGEK